MLLSLAFGGLVLLSSQAAAAQAAGTGMIVGQVIEARTGRPAVGVVVSIGGPPSIQPGGFLQVPTPRILTGPDGRFVFRSLRRGTYSLTALKPGYAEGAYGRTRAGGASSQLTLNDAERVGDVVLRIWKHASISGTVVDETGEPQVRVAVRAYRKTLAGGRRRFVASAGAQTDDRGMYRIGSLLPGDYIIATSARYGSVPLSEFSNVQPGSMGAAMVMELGLFPGPPGTTAAGILQAGNNALVLAPGTPTPPVPTDSKMAVYPQVFHPTPPSGEAAAMIKLSPGEEHLSADITITPVPVVRVSGTVSGPDGPVTRTPLRLVSSTGGEVLLESEPPTTITDLNGAFTFAAVPSGTYNLRMFRTIAARPGATPALLWINHVVDVADENIENLALSASPGLTLTGRVEFEGTAPRPAGSVQIVIENADAVSPAPGLMARSSADGAFSSAGLAPGRYYVRVANSPPGWMFKSATVNGRDAADTAVTIGDTAAEAVVTFTDRWSGLKGTVQNARGRDADAVVIVFPTHPETWGSSGQNPRRVRSARPDRIGEYALNLPPGEYFAIAILEEQTGDWRDPQFLEAASRSATRVRIADGERRTQDLRTREVK